jgi:predicted transcriptional regulator
MRWRACNLDRAVVSIRAIFSCKLGAHQLTRQLRAGRRFATVFFMTRQGLELLLERVSTWPEEAQEEFVKSVADIETKHFGVYRLNDEERDAVRRGLADMREGKLASDEAVAAVFNRYRA